MSMDKAILHGKEHRKPYRGAKAIDRTCRNHGTCPWCEENRKHKFRDKRPPEKEVIDEYTDTADVHHLIVSSGDKTGDEELKTMEGKDNAGIVNPQRIN